MKKFISVVLACMLICAFGSISVFATGETITVSSVTAASGDTVTLTVDSSSIISAFSSLSLEIAYNASDLELTKAATTAVASYSYYDEENEEDVEGTLTATKAKSKTYNPYNFGWISAYCDAEFSTKTLATLTFKVKATEPGTYPVTVSYYKGVSGTNEDGKSVNFTFDKTPLNLAYVAGGVTIEGATTNTITVSAAGKSAVFETEEEISGTVLVALYDGNRLIEVYTYDAVAEIAPVFTADTAGKTIKALWWENLTTVKPLSAAKVLE